ncbi:UNVERIFIED_CONTAM: hypothetical protein RMT77_008755 [Armadillidium vulgare]
MGKAYLQAFSTGDPGTEHRHASLISGSLLERPHHLSDLDVWNFRLYVHIRFSSRPIAAFVNILQHAGIELTESSFFPSHFSENGLHIPQMVYFDCCLIPPPPFDDD